jgi:hypothetical protein
MTQSANYPSQTLKLDSEKHIKIPAKREVKMYMRVSTVQQLVYGGNSSEPLRAYLEATATTDSGKDDLA